MLMPVIKRYSNRKLYNTETKTYITLEGIASLIRDGQEVQVVDNVTGEDLTAVTLSQIIFEQEKKQGGFLPKSVLTGLVQAGGDTLNGLRRALTTPLNLLHHVDEEINRRIQALITQGEFDEQFGQRLKDKLLAANPLSREKSELNEVDLSYLLQKHGVPTQDDVSRLIAQIETLTARIEEMQQGVPPTNRQESEEIDKSI